MNRMMVALMLMLGAPAFAERGQFAEKRVERMAGKLALDAAATARLRATMLKHQEQLAPLRKEAWETRHALEQALAAERPDQSQIVQLTEQLTLGRQKMQALRAQHMAELERQLTPEQYAKLLVSRHHRGHHGLRHRDK